MSGQPASGSSMSPFTQPGAESMPTSLLQNGVCGFSSLPSLAAPEACSISVWTVWSPSTDSGLDRTPFHSSPSLTARSPPAFQTKATALRQS